MDRDTKTGLEIGDLSVDRQDRGERRDYIFPITAAAVFLLLTGAVGGYYFYKTSEYFNPYSELYARLGINISRSLETVRGATSVLSRLDSNPCDTKTLGDFAKLLGEVGLNREAAVSIGSYNYNCPYSRDMIDKAYNASDALSDFSAAIRTSEIMLKNEPDNSHAYYLRANANEKARNYSAALPDYLTALEMIAVPSRVAYSQFYRVSHMYELTNRPCDAVNIEDTYLYFNQKFTQDAFVKKRISDLWRRGGCSSNYAIGSAHITLPTDGIVNVEINGTSARMRIDMQNVSTVLTENFADRARIKADTSSIVKPNVPTRALIFASADAQSIKLDNALSTIVPVRIAIGVTSPFGAGIDGQLGASFLNRFELKLTDTLDLQQRVRN